MSIFRTLHVALEDRVLEYVDGSFTRVLGPGRHRRRSPRRAQYRRVWMPERIETLAPQDVLTSEGVTVRVSAAIRWAVGDPRRLAEVAHEPAAVVYLAVQVALREALAAYDAVGVVRDARGPVTTALTEAARTAGEPVGVDVRAVVVKDVILPPELRASYAELATARTRAQTQLEAARAETAALRSLANGAKLLDEHPALARMRLVQSLPPGSKVQLTLQPD
jgi:regulator of protease activity HflC (stomatin/prohibitin superfamily)